MSIKKIVSILGFMTIVSLTIITSLSIKLAYENNKNISQIEDFELKMFDTAWQVKYLDEVLTHSIARYIETKDNSWLDRYNKYIGVLDEALVTIQKLSPKAWKYFEDVSSSSDKLIAYESEILKKVANNEIAEAKSIFQGDYQVQKKICFDGLIKFFNYQKGEISSYIKNTRETNSNIMWVIVISVVIILLITISIGSVGIINLLKSVNNLEDRARNLAIGDADLTKELQNNGKDEISKASESINQFIHRVRDIIISIKDTSNETTSIANELSATSAQIGNRVEEEAKIVEITVIEGQKDKDLLTILLQKSQNTKDDIEKSKTNLEDANKEVLKMVSQIQESSKIEEELSQKLNQLSTDAEQVKGVLTVIGDIADQTNLLALNAAIEAARAGEHGRGFAVVADEVRQLAERTQKSLTEINSTISVIVQSIIDASEQMNINSKDIQELAKASSEIEYKINETADLMFKSAETANESLINTTEIVDNYQNRIKKIESINELSSSNAKSLEETISTTEYLHKMMEELNIKLNEFKT